MRQILLLIVVLLGAGCEKVIYDDAWPACMESQVQFLKSLPVRNPPAEIWRYHYRGRTVYFLTPACCDIPSMVWDDDCQPICSPCGGITGNGDGMCPDFIKEARHGCLVWKDDR